MTLRTPPAPGVVLPDTEFREFGDLLAAVGAISAAESVAAAPVTLEFLDLLETDIAARSKAFWRSGVEPLPFDAFVKRVARVELTPRQRFIFESCNMMRAADLFSERRVVQELTLVLGKGSGKGFILSLFFAWASLILCEMAPDPAEFFGAAPRSGMVGLNVAPTADLARNVFYKYLKRWMMDDLLRPYWQPFLKQGTEPNADTVDLYRPDKPTSRYPSKGDAYAFFQVLSRHSNGAGLDGHNIIIWAADELAAFMKTAERDTGREIHGIMRSSASTRFGRWWLGLGMSYPREEDDLILQLRKEALADMEKFGKYSTRFTDLAATWDVRPDVRRSLPSIASDYKNDPRGAIAKYECLPMSATDAFFIYPEWIDKITHADSKPTVNWRTGKKVCQDGEERIAVFLDSIEPEAGARYFLSGDGGVRKDAATLSVFAMKTEAGTPGVERWICPECARKGVPELESRAWSIVPVRDPDTNRYFCISVFGLESDPEIPECTACLDRPPSGPAESNGRWGTRYQISDWRRSGGPVASSGGRPTMGTIQIGEFTITVPRLYEVATMAWRPRLAMRGGEKNFPVDMTNYEEVAGTLIDKFNIRRAVFDPWQSMAMVQRLNGRGGCLVTELSYSQQEQFKRAKLFGALMYNDLMELLPYKDHIPELDGESVYWDTSTNAPAWRGEDIPRIELRRLNVKGQKIDHPKNGSKDFADARFGAVWIAMEQEQGRLQAIWIE